MDPQVPVLEARGVGKRYPGVVANEDVSIRVQRAEVVGVLGENGAGKSTLMKILGGLIAPETGEVRVEGRAVNFRSAADAGEAGIALVHQHFMLVRDFSVMETIALGSRRWGRYLADTRRIRHELSELGASLGITLDPDAIVGELSAGAQQQVEIARALLQQPRVLILDEPTALLSIDERAALSSLVRRLARSGTAVILISHKIDDIVSTCDRVIVMRRGRVVDASAVSGRSREDLVRLAVGGEAPAASRRGNGSPVGRSVPAGKVALALKGIGLEPARGFCGLHDIDLTLHAGEIVAVCGVEGNGQSELVEVIAGVRRPSAGVITYRMGRFEAHGPLPVATLRRHGLVHIPEDRLRSAGVTTLPLIENWMLTHLADRTINRAGWLTRTAAAAAVADAIDRLGIRAGGPEARLGALSGGNQQKFVIARELAHRPRIVLAANPTRGLDLKTIADVEALLLAARDAGACVLWLTGDLSEMWGVADRVLVVAGGKVRGPVDVASTTQAEVGHWMTAH